MESSKNFLQKKFPLYHKIPKDIVGNLRWRLHVRKKCRKDKRFRAFIKECCAKDPLFWMATFIWTYDPLRHPDHPDRPFIPFEVQVGAFAEIFDAIGDHDLLMMKSRDMGASWMTILAFLWRWQYMDNQSFLLGSAKEEMVDKSGSKKTLFCKMDYALDRMPYWLKPEIRRNHLLLENMETGSTVEGEAMHPNFGTGDRKTGIMLDEAAKVACGDDVWASTNAVSRCRICVSTPYGINNVHYRLRHETNIKQIILGWFDHPDKKRGLYRYGNGKKEILDKDYVFPENYQFVPDGDLRSPWYDIEEDRMRAHPRLFAQEVKMDERGSGGMFFTSDSIMACIEKFSIVPLSVGHLIYDRDHAEPVKFREDYNEGNLKLWIMLENGIPPEAQYVIGCDIAQGTGASNSTACVWDVQRQTKVAEFCYSRIRPEAFTKFIVSLAKWFHGARLAWEDRGPGRTVSMAIQEIGYDNYYRRPTNDTGEYSKESDKPGWSPSQDAKTALLESYRDSLEVDTDGRDIDDPYLTNVSRVSLMECLDYIFDDKGGVTHAKSKNSEDASGAGNNHGDLVIGDALSNMLLKEMFVERKHAPLEVNVVNCFAARRKLRQDKRKKASLLSWRE